MKKISEINYTFNLTTLVIAGVLILALAFGGWKLSQNRADKLKAENLVEVKLKNALVADVAYYKNKTGEITAEKLTLQATVKSLENANNNLNLNQKELLKRIKEVEKDNSVITAALIETKVTLDSLRQGIIVVDTVSSKITISDNLPEIKYNFEIGKVKPAIAGIKPTFKINELTLPNKQFIEFHWGERKEGYPISFSVSNSNKYFTTTTIESYAIPQLIKPIVKPSGWNKFTNFFKKGSNTIITFGVGAAVGAGAILFLVK